MNHSEFVISCGGIQPEPSEPPMEHRFIDPTLQGNERIVEAIRLFRRENTDAAYIAACMAIRQQMLGQGHLIFPADAVDDMEDADFIFHTLDIDGAAFLVAFTDQEEYSKAPPSGAVSHFIDSMLETVMQQNLAGMIINPWGEQLVLCKADIAMILSGEVHSV